MKFATKTFLSLGLIVMFGLITFVNGQTKRVWHLRVASREDIGETAEKFKADLKEAFEAIGDEVVDEASKESTDLNFYLGKDDDDDDNDGAVDDKDVSDSNSDGIVNEQDMAEVFDLDEEIPDVMKAYPDNEKDEGIYIYLEKETGLAMVFISKVDSLKETGVATLSGNGFFQNASFQPRNALMAENKVAAEVAKTVDNTISTRVWVGNLALSTGEDDVRDVLGRVGEVKDVQREKDKDGFSKNSVIVTMANSQGAANVLNKLWGTLINGSPIRLGEYRERTRRTGAEQDKSKSNSIRRGGGGDDSRPRSSYGSRGQP